MSRLDRIAETMEALSVLGPRFAGSEAEREALDAVRARLADPDGARVEGFGGHTAPWVVLGFHGVTAFVSGALGFWFPALGAMGCLLTTASLVGEGTGRLGLLRLWIPKVPSYNLVVPPPGEASLGSVVLCTPLDTPRLHVRRPRWARRPLAGVFASTVLLSILLVLRVLSEPWGTPLLGLYLASLAVNGLMAAMVFATWRSPRVGPSDVGGLAATVELLASLRADPIPDVDVWTVFTGCGRSHQDGIEAFLSLRGERLARPTLVVSLLELGRAPLLAATTEGPLWRQPHRPTGPALVERMRWAGIRLPSVDRAEASDGRAAANMGFRALTLFGGTGDPDPAATDRAVQIVETLLRWYGEDLARVEVRRARDRAASARDASAIDDRTSQGEE